MFEGYVGGVVVVVVEQLTGEKMLGINYLTDFHSLFVNLKTYI